MMMVIFEVNDKLSLKPQINKLLKTYFWSLMKFVVVFLWFHNKIRTSGVLVTFFMCLTFLHDLKTTKWNQKCVAAALMSTRTQNKPRSYLRKPK